VNATAPKTRRITAQNIPPELIAADQWAYWQGSSDIEAIDHGHFVLVVYADRLRRLDI
jgi:hypothetical protein